MYLAQMIFAPTPNPTAIAKYNTVTGYVDEIADKEIESSLMNYLKDQKDFYKYCLTEINIKINEENAHSYLLYNLGLTLKTALNDNLKLEQVISIWFISKLISDVSKE